MTTEDLLEELQCDVCSTKEHIAGVASSPVGPMSFCYCITCLKACAQPEFTLEYLYSEVGHKGEGLAAWVSQISTYKNGGYLTWDDWVAWRRTDEGEAWWKDGQ